MRKSGIKEITPQGHPTFGSALAEAGRQMKKENERIGYNFYDMGCLQLKGSEEKAIPVLLQILKGDSPKKFLEEFEKVLEYSNTADRPDPAIYVSFKSEGKESLKWSPYLNQAFIESGASIHSTGEPVTNKDFLTKLGRASWGTWGMVVVETNLYITKDVGDKAFAALAELTKSEDAMKRLEVRIGIPDTNKTIVFRHVSPQVK